MAAKTFVWNEPEGAASPRGWLSIGGVVTGFYLDYGPDHHRQNHKTRISAGRTASFCMAGSLCRDCQPGDIFCVRYPDGPGTKNTARYVETVEEARQFVETGNVESAGYISARNGKWHRATVSEPTFMHDETSGCGLTFRPLNVTWNGERPPTTRLHMCQRPGCRDY